MKFKFYVCLPNIVFVFIVLSVFVSEVLFCLYNPQLHIIAFFSRVVEEFATDIRICVGSIFVPITEDILRVGGRICQAGC